jgi:hypothetical protein
MSLSNKLYYQIKPFIPRWVQIQVRRQVVLRKRARYSHIWPIDPNAGTPPEGWSGWPDGKKFAFVLMHDVDTQKGHEKCLQLAELDEKMGFRSSFNFVPERYNISSEVRRILVAKGFEMGVHGLKHDGKLFSSRKTFQKQAARINHYLKDWKSVGFVSPSMHNHLDWISQLDIKHDCSTFDTDPFEPQPDGVGTIFPFMVHSSSFSNAINSTNPSNPINPINSYVELPYTLPQDHTLFVIMKEEDIGIWKKKLDWIAQNGGMALLMTHPDYMNFDGKKPNMEEYPIKFYQELLNYIKSKYDGQYWHPLPREMAHFWKQKMVLRTSP